MRATKLQPLQLLLTLRDLQLDVLHNLIQRVALTFKILFLLP